MAKRTNHYDVAFEEYLRNLRTPYVAEPAATEPGVVCRPVESCRLAVRLTPRPRSGASMRTRRQ